MKKFGLASFTLMNHISTTVTAIALGAHRELTTTPASVPVFGSIQSSFGNSFSEENGGHSEYRAGAPIAGIRCSGDHCDNKSLKFYTQTPPNRPTMECYDTRQRDVLGWVYKGKARTFSEARSACSGFTYVSLECPEGGEFNFFCVNDRGNDRLPRDACMGNPGSTPHLNGGSNGHCTGQLFTTDGIATGGWHRGAVYAVSGGRDIRRGPWITDRPSFAHGSVDAAYRQQVSSYDCKDVLPNGYITRLQCQDDRCDNIRFTCESVTGVTIDESRTTISDENGDGYTCSPGFVLTGIGCSGDWCDNLYLTCSKFNARVTIDQIQAVYQYKGIGAVELNAERSLSNTLSDARSSSTESSWGFSATVEVGFAGEVFSGGASVTTETARSVSSSVQSAIERTDAQVTAQTISITSSTDCGSPYGVVYQYGYTLIDSNGGSSNIRLPTFVCSMQSLPPPKCIPQDCGNVMSVVVNGIGPGCQCCRAGSASALAGNPIC